MTENPMFYLLDSKQARDHELSYEARAFAMTGLGLVVLWVLSGLYFAAFEGMNGYTQFAYGCLQFLAYPLAVAILVGGPLRQLQSDASIHASLLNGRCYSEILGTLARPSALVDGVARYSARAVLAGWKWPLAVALVGMLAGAPPLVMVVAFLVWLPTVTLLTWSGSYLAQQLSMWNTQLRDSNLGTLADLMAGLTTAVPAAFSLLTALITTFWLPAVGVPALLIYLGFTVGLARYLCLVGLERLPGLHSRVEQAGRKLLGTRRNPYIRPFSQNPVVARECQRDAARIPLGLFGWLFFRHNVVWLFCLLLCLMGAPANAIQSQEFFWLLLTGLAFIQAMRAARRTLGAVVTELEQKTFDALQTTNLRHTEYVDGWLAIGTVPVWLQNLVLSVPLVGLAVQGQVAPDQALLAWLAMMLMPAFGAALGLYASVASSRAETHQRLSNAVVFSGVLGSVLFVWLAMQTIQTISGTMVALFICTFLTLGFFAARQQVVAQTSHSARR